MELVKILFVILTIFYIESRPITDNYLIKYGYLPTSMAKVQFEGATEAGLDQTGPWTNAIKNLQFEAGLDQTGTWTNETLHLLSVPRCGVKWASRTKRFVTSSLKWKNISETGETMVTWHLKNTARNLTLATTISIFHMVFDLWSQHANINFTYMSIETNADIIIEFLYGDHGDGTNFDGPGNILAHAFYPGTSYGGDAHFDIDEEWDIYGYNDNISLLNVALHEIGHSLGLQHSSITNSIMYAWYISPIFYLSEDDILGIRELYGFRMSTSSETTSIETTSIETTSTEKTIYKAKNIFLQNSQVYINPSPLTITIQ
jgi:predicted Zn-dependent protease